MAKGGGVKQAENPKTAAFVGHGGRIDRAMQAWPAAPRPWLDLSTGINPLGWAPPATGIDYGPLPSRTALRGLEAAAAGFFDADPASVAALPGSEVALRLLDLLGLPGPYRHVAPGYGSHAGFGDPIAADAVAEEAARGGTILLANPNNPDGRLFSPADLSALASRLAERGGWLVVDEAFADALPEAGIAATQPDNAVVLRSFGKFFGLAGVRLGFCIAAEPVLAALRARLGEWPVGTAAIAWGTAAYADTDWIARTRDRLHHDAAALDALLARRGLEATGACPLFRLVETDRAEGLFARLAAAGILVRPFAAQPRWLRFGVPATDADRQRLDRALCDG